MNPLENSKSVSQFEKSLEDNIFAYMDLTSQSYMSIFQMPYLSFQNGLKWKMDLEEEKKKSFEKSKNKKK